MFQLSRNTIDLWLKRQAETGDYQAKSNRPRRTSNKITDWHKFAQFAQTHGNKTQAQMAQLWESDISARSISRAMKSPRCKQRGDFIDPKSRLATLGLYSVQWLAFERHWSYQGWVSRIHLI